MFGCGLWRSGIEFVGPFAGFWVPGLGRSGTADWNVDGAHMAERCALFVIIALGESLLVTGATAAAAAGDRATLCAFLSRVRSAASRCGGSTSTSARSVRQHRIAHAAAIPGDGALGVHLCAHPHRRGNHRLRGRGRGRARCIRDTAALGGLLAILGGPACYLLGAAWFKWLTNDRRTPPLSHMIGLVLIAMLAWPALTHAITPLICGVATTRVFAVVAGWEAIALSTRKRRERPSDPLASGAFVAQPLHCGNPVVVEHAFLAFA